MIGPILTKHSKKSSFIQTQGGTEPLEGKLKFNVVPLEEMLKREIEPVEGKLKFKVIPSDDLLKNYVPRTNINRFEAAIVKESNFAVLKYISGHLDLRRIKKILLTASHSLYSKNVFNNVKAITEANNVRAIVDFKKVNHTRYVNKYFESINSLLPHTGIYIGCVESNRQRNKRLYHKKKKILATLFILTEFIFHRILPKLKFFKGFYFGITRGKYRFLSTAETLGRLVSCGFDIIEFKEIRNLTYFVVMKTGEPKFDRNPSYGPFLNEISTGTDGRYKLNFKLRLRHPYSEYLEDHDLKLDGSSFAGAIKNDIGLTSLGKVIRGSWLVNVTRDFDLFIEKVRSIELFPGLKLDNILFIKHSLGKGGKLIRIYKFRTMKMNAEKEDHIITEFNSHGNPINDTRITPMGKFMRKVWIDELPQLINVIKGDIKFVGIRPMRESDWERYPADIKEKALMQRPGIMGIQYGSACKGGIEKQYDYFRDYLDQWEKSPFLADFNYFFRIWYNIFFKGVRSD